MNNSKIKFEKNWLEKSLENLEKDFWENPGADSYLVTTCYQLRKKQIKDFNTEDLRIMIGQNIGLKYLVPRAIETLNKNILADGDFYEGDLLNAVLHSDKEYWQKNFENWNIVCELFEKNIALLKSFQTTKTIRDWLFKGFEKFKIINT